MDWTTTLSLVSAGLGVAALGVGVPALVWGRKAELRARERHNVQWTLWWCPSGHLHVKNVGKHAAKHVVVQVEPSRGQPQEQGADSVRAGQMLTFKLPELRDEIVDGFAHVNIDWETERGSVRSSCQTLERLETAM